MDEETKYKTHAMRAEFGRMLKAKVGPGKISPEIAAPYLGISHTSLYSRLKDPGYLPSVVECDLIGKFLEGVHKLRESWRAVVSLKAFEALASNAIATGFFNPEILKILSSRDSLEKRIDRLTKRVLKDGAEKLKAKDLEAKN